MVRLGIRAVSPHVTAAPVHQLLWLLHILDQPAKQGGGPADTSCVIMGWNTVSNKDKCKGWIVYLVKGQVEYYQVNNQTKSQETLLNINNNKRHRSKQNKKQKKHRRKSTF